MSIKKKNVSLIGILVLLVTIVFVLIWKFKSPEEFIIPSKYKEYSDENFYFKYPESAYIVNFADDEEDIGTIRVIVDDNINVDLDPVYGASNAFKETQQYYFGRAKDWRNRAPRKIPNKNLKGYYATRFGQNVEFSFLQDYAFFETSNGLFELSMSPREFESYSKGHRAFKLILNTLEVKF